MKDKTDNTPLPNIAPARRRLFRERIQTALDVWADDLPGVHFDFREF